MAIYKWRRHPTQHFGDTWVPIAQVEIASTAGEFQAFALQIDSGAVVSLLRRSAAAVLGLRLEDGRRVALGSVGGGEIVAYVHELPIRFGDGPECNAPFAIADSERVPNLLGRSGIFDRFQLNFDATLRETHLAAPWLDEAGRRIWELLLETEKHILARFSTIEQPAHVRNVLTRLLNRGEMLLVSAMGLVKLHRAYAGPLLIRALFELAIQAEYLVKDADARSRSYLDFEHITRHRQSQALISQPCGPVSDWIARSPERSGGELRNKIEFERVHNAFRTKKGALHSNWYCMSVADLAKALGRTGEYRLWYSTCSGWAHADPFSTSGMASGGYDARITTVVCWGMYARMLLHVANFGKIVLTSEQFAVLEKISVPIQ